MSTVSRESQQASHAVLSSLYMLYRPTAAWYACHAGLVFDRVVTALYIARSRHRPS